MINSLGLPVHAHPDGIENFRQWFNDSKVVDETGHPLVVYHGTGADFPQFGNGRGAIYFTSDPDVATEYANQAQTDDYEGDNEPSPNIISAYLLIKNPLIIDEAWAKENLDFENERDWTALDIALYDAQRSGHDGAILRGVVDYSGMDNQGKRLERPYDQFVVFSPYQIKSAIGNSGSFDPTSPCLTDHPSTSKPRRKP